MVERQQEHIDESADRQTEVDSDTARAGPWNPDNGPLEVLAELQIRPELVPRGLVGWQIEELLTFLPPPTHDVRIAAAVPPDLSRHSPMIACPNPDQSRVTSDNEPGSPNTGPSPKSTPTSAHHAAS